MFFKLSARLQVSSRGAPDSDPDIQPLQCKHLPAGGEDPTSICCLTVLDELHAGLLKNRRHSIKIYLFVFIQLRTTIKDY